MSRLARLTLSSLLLAAAAVPAGAAPPATGPASPAADRPPVATLIDRLDDADADVRKQAFDTLQVRMAEATRGSRTGDAALPPDTANVIPALRAALRGPRPAVAEAAGVLLLRRQWYSKDDSPSVTLLLKAARYGEQTPEARAEILQNLLGRRLPGVSRTAVRIASQDPSDEVSWSVFTAALLDPAGVKAGLALDAASRPAGLTAAVGRAMVFRGDPAGLPLLHDVQKQESELPTASPVERTAFVGVLVEGETRFGDPAAAAVTVRDTLAGPLDAGDRNSLLADLLGLHAAHGPLPGVGGDLNLADKDPESNAAFTLAAMARRIGMPTASATLFGAAINAHDDDDTGRAARLSDAADFLAHAGASDIACRTLEAVTKIDTVPTRGRVMAAYVRLSELHDLAGRNAAAGDALQRAIDRSDAQNPLPRMLRTGLWTREDDQGRVYWYYLLDADARGDKAGVAKQAENLVASGSTDGDLFLNALPYLQSYVPADRIDAYFDRAYAQGKSRVQDFSNEPMFRNDLAWLLARSGRRLPEALLLADQAARAMPDEAAVLDTLAEAKFRNGFAAEAAALEAKALEQSPEDDAFMRKQLARFRQAAATQPVKAK